jgi:hypothetical protein
MHLGGADAVGSVRRRRVGHDVGATALAIRRRRSPSHAPLCWGWIVRRRDSRMSRASCGDRPASFAHPGANSDLIAMS